MASRRIDDLHPKLQPIALAFLAECLKQKLDVIITCTYRSGAEQDECYAQGRTKPGRIITKARAGQSRHNNIISNKPASLAFDVVPLRHGKLVWGTTGNGIDNNPSDDDKDDLELWQRVGSVGMALGLNWYGRPDAPFREMPHFELKL